MRALSGAQRFMDARDPTRRCQRKTGAAGRHLARGRLAHDRAKFSTESPSISLRGLKAELLALPLIADHKAALLAARPRLHLIGCRNFHLAYTLAPMAAAKAGDSTAVSKETAMQYRDGTDRATISVGITAPNGGRSEMRCAARSTSRFFAAFQVRRPLPP